MYNRLMTSTPAPSIRRTRLRLALLAVGAISLNVLIGCSSSSASETQRGTTDSIEPAVASVEGLVVIDVRTPGEFTEQHLQGALNIDIQGDDFVERISQLDRNGAYAVYCRSGNRSSQAVAAMKTLGFTNVADHGSVAEASDSLGIPVIS